ncbi:MAG: protoporphyrinogen oxidase [Acidobacteriota bacterium]|nr:protoporphyrinogen oxidase [Acidobacteriota bacterium]
MKHIVVIGGGMTGLAAAHRLLERSRELREQVQVTLLEASPRVGGIVRTEERDGFLLERGPDSFISEKPQALELAKRLGLESHLIETNENHRRSFIVRQGRLLPVPEGFHLLAPARLWPFITSEIFSWPGKARMAMDLLLPRRNVNGNADANTDESLAHFVRRRLGREALERMAQPMIGGIYTADPETLSLQATMPRFLEMERKHRSLIRALRRQGSNPTVSPAVTAERDQSGTSGARYSLFLSFDRGMQFFTDQLAKRVLDFEFQISDGEYSPASAIRVNTRVESLALERETTRAGEVKKWKVRTNSNETFVADAVCLALPGPVSARLLRDVDTQLSSELGGISYASSGTINLAYKRADIPHRLDGFGFVVPFIEKRSLIACTFSSVKFAGRAPEGCALLRAFVGGALQPDMLNLEEADLISRVRDDLRDLLGIEWPPLFSELTKWEHSMPQYHVGHIQKVKRIEKRVAALPGLVLAGNAYSGLGIPDCIRSGETAVDRLVEMFAK